MSVDPALHEALRLAVDPPGGVSVEALRELCRDPAAGSWDVATAASHLGVSPHTLRYYERLGLVRVARDDRGHRRYDASAVRRLVFLTRMRASGMPIAALRRYVDLVEDGEATVPARRALLREHRAALRSRIAELQLALAATEYKIAAYAEAPGIPTDPIDLTDPTAPEDPEDV